MFNKKKKKFLKLVLYYVFTSKALFAILYKIINVNIIFWSKLDIKFNKTDRKQEPIIP